MVGKGVPKRRLPGTLRGRTVKGFPFAVTGEGRVLWSRLSKESKQLVKDFFFERKDPQHLGLRVIGRSSHLVYELQLRDKQGKPCRCALKVFGKNGVPMTTNENGCAQMLYLELVKELNLRYGKARLLMPGQYIARPGMILMEFIDGGYTIPEFKKKFAHNQQLLGELDFALADFSTQLSKKVKLRDPNIAGDRVRINLDEATGELFVFLFE